MAYPDELVGDLDSPRLVDFFGLEGVGTPVFELYDDDDDLTTYRFASLERRGTVYFKIQQTAK